VFVSINVWRKKNSNANHGKGKKCMDVNKNVEPNVIQHTWLEGAEVL
jgi:hypothetical protein